MTCEEELENIKKANEEARNFIVYFLTALGQMDHPPKNALPYLPKHMIVHLEMRAQLLSRGWNFPLKG